METLFTPWRYEYISGAKSSSECFLCAAGEHPEDDERLVVHAGEFHVVLLNRHPYTNGHLMVAPRQHLRSPAEESPAARAGFWQTVLAAQRALERAYSPDGFNVGMNVGRAAGAGVPDHFHLHVVPRWHGDTNFMSTVGGVRIVPEELGTVLDKLRPLFDEEGVR